MAWTRTLGKGSWWVNPPEDQSGWPNIAPDGWVLVDTDLHFVAYLDGWTLR